MKIDKQPFLYLYRYSSLPLPAPILVPPQAWVLAAADKEIRACVGRIPGRIGLRRAPGRSDERHRGGTTLAKCHRPARSNEGLAGSQASFK